MHIQSSELSSYICSCQSLYLKYSLELYPAFGFSVCPHLLLITSSVLPHRLHMGLNIIFLQGRTAEIFPGAAQSLTDVISKVSYPSASLLVAFSPQLLSQPPCRHLFLEGAKILWDLSCAAQPLTVTIQPPRFSDEISARLCVAFLCENL